MPDKRTRLKIYFDILRAIKSGSNRKTWIMRAANISGYKFNEMLTSLISQGFVEELKTLNWNDKRKRTSYNLTPRGKRTMSYLEQCELLSDKVILGELLKDEDLSVK
jgi:predicted transcriptional regulator